MRSLPDKLASLGKVPISKEAMLKLVDWLDAYRVSELEALATAQLEIVQLAQGRIHMLAELSALMRQRAK